ncbi:Xaa-His dipeptidase [Clostridium baratii]|uniref:Xaa-His dipeptidase n=1 Tax=Clostridium baratii TaxID=1561 RepID=UPI0030D119E4
MKSVKENILSNLKLIKSMAEEGKTDKEIAEIVGVSYSTWKKYKAEYPEIKDTILEAKDTRDQEVEKALFKNCIGYSYYEEVPTKIKKEVMAEDGKTVLIQEDVKISKVKKFKGPDLAAQKYYLNNRKKAKWKEDPAKNDIDKKNLKLKAKEIEAKNMDI